MEMQRSSGEGVIGKLEKYIAITRRGGINCKAVSIFEHLISQFAISRPRLLDCACKIAFIQWQPALSDYFRATAGTGVVDYGETGTKRFEHRIRARVVQRRM